MDKDFTTASELGRVKYLQWLGLSIREIAQFSHESDRMNAKGKFATDQNYKKKIDNMVKIIEPLFNQEVQGGDLGRTHIDYKYKQKIYDPKDNHANAIDNTNPDYDARLDGLGMDERNPIYREEEIV